MCGCYVALFWTEIKWFEIGMFPVWIDGDKDLWVAVEVWVPKAGGMGRCCADRNVSDLLIVGNVAELDEVI